MQQSLLTSVIAMMSKLVLSVALLLSSAAVSQEQGKESLLAVDVFAVSDSYAISDAINITFTLTNLSEQTLFLLLWATPFEGVVTGEFVHVSRDGMRLPYQGPVLKRREPADSDYRRLERGSSISATLDLHSMFPITEPGRYMVVLPSLQIQRMERGEQSIVSVNSEVMLELPVR